VQGRLLSVFYKVRPFQGCEQKDLKVLIIVTQFVKSDGEFQKCCYKNNKCFRGPGICFIFKELSTRITTLKRQQFK
jgi:hypothetical protein